MVVVVSFGFGFVSFCKISTALNGVPLERKNHWYILNKKNKNGYLSSITQSLISCKLEYPSTSPLEENAVK